MRYNYAVLKIRKETPDKYYFNDNAMLFYLKKSGKILGIIEANKDIINDKKLSRGFYKFDEIEEKVDLRKLLKLKFQPGEEKFKVQKLPHVESIPLKDFYKKVLFIKNKRSFAIVKKIEKDGKIFIVKFKGKKLYYLNKFINDEGNFILSRKYSQFKKWGENFMIDTELFNKKYNINKILERLGYKDISKSS